MRFLVKVVLCTKRASELIRTGKLSTAIQNIVAEQKPEQVFFVAEGGKRTCYLVLNVGDASELPKYAEPWFLGFDASVEFLLAMTPQDLDKAGPDIKHAVEKWGQL
jgi:hypothetical protein